MSSGRVDNGASDDDDTEAEVSASPRRYGTSICIHSMHQLICVVDTCRSETCCEVFWSVHTGLDLEESSENRGKLALISFKLKLTLGKMTLKLYRLASTVDRFVFMECFL